MNKLRKISKRTSIDSVFWIFFIWIYLARPFVSNFDIRISDFITRCILGAKNFFVRFVVS